MFEGESTHRVWYEFLPNISISRTVQRTPHGCQMLQHSHEYLIDRLRSPPNYAEPKRLRKGEAGTPYVQLRFAQLTPRSKCLQPFEAIPVPRTQTPLR